MAKKDPVRFRLVNLQPSKDETFALVFNAINDLL